MLPLLYAGGAVVSLVAGYLLLKRKSTAMPSTAANVAVSVPTSISFSDGLKASDMVPVPLGNETWLVARDYIGPVGIGEAAGMAKAAGFELPSPALVDAIWRQADLKVLPPTRAKNETTQAVYDDQKARIAALIASAEATNGKAKLIGGTYKDIVQVGGLPQLYGWHVEDGKSIGVALHAPFTPGPGKIVQGPSGSRHGQFYKDYSQGVRFVKRMVT